MEIYHMCILSVLCQHMAAEPSSKWQNYLDLGLYIDMLWIFTLLMALQDLLFSLQYKYEIK